jgi:hypothetical protein
MEMQSATSKIGNNKRRRDEIGSKQRRGRKQRQKARGRRVISVAITGGGNGHCRTIQRL